MVISMDNNTKVSFDDLFVNEQKDLNKEEKNVDTKPFIFAILTYFIVFFLISSLLQAIFISNKNNLDTFTSTEATIENIANELGFSFSKQDDYFGSKNKDDVNYLEYGDYAIIYSKKLAEDADFMGMLDFEADEDITKLFKKKSFYVKFNNSGSKEFLTEFSLTKSDFDFSISGYTSFKAKISTLINFITYVLAIIPLAFLLFKFIKSDFKRLNKNVKIFLSFIIVGYLYIVLGNIITNFATSFLRLITNTKEITSMNQTAINKMLHSNYAVLMIIPVVIIGPIVEELVFRKSFFGIIKNDKIALVVSSLLFGLIHVIGEPNIIDFIINLISYSIPGFALGLFYMKNDKNIVAPIIAHSVSNLISVIAILFLL